METPTPSPSPIPSAPSGFAFAYPDLPIMAGREAILKALAENPVIVVQGGTGSGKTTQLPKFLLEAGYSTKGLIGVTQPRRIAALAITDRLRQETLQPNLIGSKIRFHEDVPHGARVKVMTDGILLQEFRRDPLLRRYSCIVLDEAHERSLNVDILLGIFKGIMPRRKDFRLVVTSATLDADRFAAFFASPAPGAHTIGSPGSAEPAVVKAPVVEVEGRQYPVAIEYWDPQDTGGGDDPEGEETPSRAIPPVEAAAVAIRDLQHRRMDNLLCFLPTEKEINELHRELERDLGSRFEILPLYSRLGPADQKKVFQESHKPKIILATNIAETSLTIPGIGYVVDTGLARISRYHAQTKIQGLPIERISQASARQRAGRAGRVKPGVCIRLYGEEEFQDRPAFTEPEILRSNLANVVLQLLALGLSVDDFPFPDPPVPAALKGAFRQLHELGAVDGPDTTAALTEEGHKLSRIPVDVALGKILLKAADFGTLQPAVILAAGVTIQDARFLPKEEPDRQKAAALHRRFEDPRSDFVGLLALWIWIHKEWDSLSQRKLRRLCLDNYLSYNRVREWIDLAEQFGRLLKVTAGAKGLKIEDLKADALHKSILAGFLPFLARKKPEDVSYRLAGDKEAFIHPGSSLSKRKPEWIVAGEVRQTSRTFIYRACEINPAWIEELAPEACKRSYFNVAWNPERGFVEAVERLSYKGFVLRQDRRVNYEAVAPEECTEIFWREGVIRTGAGAPFPFRDRNQAVLESLAALERKVRHRGLVPDEDALVHWYRERAPGVTSKVRLERFLRGHPQEDETKENAGPEATAEWKSRPKSEGKTEGKDGRPRPIQGGSPALDRNHILEFSVGDWSSALASLDAEAWLSAAPVNGGPSAPKGLAALAKQAQGGDRILHPLERLFPDALESAGQRYPLSYLFDHGNPSDGLTLEVGPEGLAVLSVPLLFNGVPGWRAWIWDWAMEKLSAKSRQPALERKAEIAKAWARGLSPANRAEGADGNDPVPSPAAVLAALLAEASDSASGLSFPGTWPSYLTLHVLVKSPNGRRSLLQVDPSWGDAELFAAARSLAFGEAASAKPFGEWLGWAGANLAMVPDPLAWRGLAYGVRIPSRPSAANLPLPACGFFSDRDEAAFHQGLARKALAARDGKNPGAKDPAKDTAKDPVLKSLSSFFAKRLQSLLDAWSCPDKVREETAPLRTFLAESWLPALAVEAFGAAEALVLSEKALPPIRAALPKPGSGVKSLAALGQAVSRGHDPGNWAGAFLALQAAFLSWKDFLRWYGHFAQPPAASKHEIAELLRQITSLKDWEEMVASPYQGAWLALALDDRIPAAPEAGSRSGKPARPQAWTGGLAECAAAFEAARKREEAIRKGAKVRRDALAAGIAGAGQNLGGLPQELRQALEVLDKAGTWAAKVQAGLALELHLHKLEGRSGTASAAVVPGASGAIAAKAAKADSATEERKEQLMKGLSGRFKKL